MQNSLLEFAIPLNLNLKPESVAPLIKKEFLKAVKNEHNFKNQFNAQIDAAKEVTGKLIKIRKLHPKVDWVQSEISARLRCGRVIKV